MTARLGSVDGGRLGMNETFRERVTALRIDRTSGASELARRALADLAELARRCPASTAAELKSEALAFAADLASARPSMAPLAALVGRWRELVAALDVEELGDLRRALADEAERLEGLSRRAVAEAAIHAAALVPSGATIITLSRSSTVLEVFRRLDHRSVRAIVSESRPLCEGSVLAGELGRLGVRTELVTDAQLGHFAVGADVALVGADAVLADGSVVNKAGTRLLALAAREVKVPFWVCCESFKRSPRLPAGFELEEKAADELGAPELPGVAIRNVYFDITPPTLVSRWIDETGAKDAWSG